MSALQHGPERANHLRPRSPTLAHPMKILSMPCAYLWQRAVSGGDFQMIFLEHFLRCLLTHDATGVKLPIYRFNLSSVCQQLPAED